MSLSTGIESARLQSSLVAVDQLSVIFFMNIMRMTSVHNYNKSSEFFSKPWENSITASLMNWICVATLASNIISCGEWTRVVID